MKKSTEPIGNPAKLGLESYVPKKKQENLQKLMRLRDVIKDSYNQHPHNEQLKERLRKITLKLARLEAE